MTSARVRLVAPERHLVVCEEYADIEVMPEEVMAPNGQLRILAEALKHYVTTDFKDGRLRVRSRGVSGLFALTEEITVQVRPRFPLTNLTHMVSVCGYVPTVLASMRPYRTADRWEDWMLDVVSDAFLIAMETVEERGLLRIYERRTGKSSFPHGRIQVGETINNYESRGIVHKVVYSWFEKSADNPANRCLRAAALRLHDQYSEKSPEKGTRDKISRLGNVLRLLEEASDDQKRSFVNDFLIRGEEQLPESREYYRPALNLAIVALNQRGLDLDTDGGSVSLGSLLVKSEDLFEDFVRLSLQRALAEHPELQVLDGNVEPGKRNLYENVAEELSMLLPPHEVVRGKIPDATPDVLFENTAGSFPLVADVKYTNVTRYADRAELEQALVYGVRYRSPVVVTIHPRKQHSAKGLVVSGRIGDIIVAQYRVDLAADDLDAEMEAMAVSLVELIAAMPTT